MTDIFDFSEIINSLHEIFVFVVIYIIWLIAYGFAMLGIILAAFILIFGKIQMWLALAFMPIGVLAYLVDKGKMLSRMFGVFLTGIGTYLVAGVLTNTTADAYANAIVSLAKKGKLTGEHDMSMVMIALFSVLYSIFFILVMRNAINWAQGLFGGVGFDPTWSTLNRAVGQSVGRAGAKGIAMAGKGAWHGMKSVWRGISSGIR